ELRVDAEDPGGVDGARKPVPAEDGALSERRAVGSPAQRDRPHGNTREREHAVEGPDAARRAESIARRSAERAQDLARRAARDGKEPARDHRPLPLLISPNLLRTICCHLCGYALAPTRSEPLVVI